MGQNQPALQVCSVVYHSCIPITMTSKNFPCIKIFDTTQFETATIDGLVSSWSENISVSFCLWAPRYKLTPMRPRSSSRGRNTSASVTVTVAVTVQ